MTRAHATYRGGPTFKLWQGAAQTFCTVARLILLLALLLSGGVPQGMMRTQNAQGGTELVLCTPEGPRAIWMAADGSIQPRAPLPQKNAEMGKCLAVNLSFAAVQVGASSLVLAAEFSDFRPDLTAQPPVYAPLRPRAQPRAPPTFS